MIKECRRCGLKKDESEYRRDPRYKGGLGSWCIQCHRERGSEWSKENRARRAEKARNNRKISPEKYQEIDLRFKARHKERLAAEHSDWARKNRDKRCASSARRKAAKLMATPMWADQEKINEIYAEANRLSQETGVSMHVDHIYPLQGKTVCGLHCEHNLQILPAAENISKKNKMPTRIRKEMAQPRLDLPTPEQPKQETFL